MKVDVIVLGAGIVGVCTALHLQDRAHRVVIVDRKAPGEEASFGNAGLVQSASVMPYGFPRELRTLLRYAGNRATSIHYDLRSLPSYLPFLARYWWESEPRRQARAGQDLLPLIRTSVDEHLQLIKRAGLDSLVRRSGWLEAYRSPAIFGREAQVASRLARDFNLGLSVLNASELKAREPAIRDGFAGAIHWLDPITISSPGDLTKGYAALFRKDGGHLLVGDATTLLREGNGWLVRTASGPVYAKNAVIALGAWSDTVYRRFGYRIPLMPKRGYHMHFAPVEGQSLSVPIVDVEEGYVISPMNRGMRLTTGVELAARGRPPGTFQLDRAERSARRLFPLGERVDNAPWHGMRPCTPDMRPVIGPAPHHPGLWFAFGHNHHGFTLGPGTGRLLAELISEIEPFVDATPFRAERFG